MNIDQIMLLADKYADLSFDQGLNQRTEDEAPENAREELLEALKEVRAKEAAHSQETQRDEFAWLVVQEACETDPADRDNPECICILRRNLKGAVMAAFQRDDVVRQGKKGTSA